MWLSKPGIDVLSTVDPNHMLLCPVKKNDQILMRGFAQTSSANQQVTVYFPTTLQSPPFVFFWGSVSGDTMHYPFNIFKTGFVFNESYKVTIYTDRMVFENSAGGRYFQYIVASRGLL